MRQGQYFLVDILAVLFSISGGSEKNSKSSSFLGRWLGNFGVKELRIKLSQLSIKLKSKFKLSLAKA